MQHAAAGTRSSVQAKETHVCPKGKKFNLHKSEGFKFGQTVWIGWDFLL